MNYWNEKNSILQLEIFPNKSYTNNLHREIEFKKDK